MPSTPGRSSSKRVLTRFAVSAGGRIVTMTLEEALAAVLDDEYRARSTYLAAIGVYGRVRPFV
jgi:hypothetical protein